uniref:Cytochrome c maturation protein CcmFN n=1 Tax=Viscum album TaxID=3972 RepID=A0A0R5EQU4_VISAL|nr:cytochrome c maturation protein CcmFN [Viscum album]AHL69440.1 cytochrome c maturation protein CcmFN [Viscum album]
MMERFHYSFFPVAFLTTRSDAFGNTYAFGILLLAYLGYSFRQSPNHLTGQFHLSANAPMLFHLSGTWATHDGSILYGFLLLRSIGFLSCFANVFLNVRTPTSILQLGERGGRTAPAVGPSSSVSVAAVQYVALCCPWGLGKRVRASLFCNGHMVLEWMAKGIPFVPCLSLFGVLQLDSLTRFLGIWHYRLTLPAYRKWGWGMDWLVFAPMLTGMEDPFVAGVWGVRTEPLAASNPVPLDPVSAIHPPSIYWGALASCFVAGIMRSDLWEWNERPGIFNRNDRVELNWCYRYSFGTVRGSSELNWRPWDHPSNTPMRTTKKLDSSIARPGHFKSRCSLTRSSKDQDVPGQKTHQVITRSDLGYVKYPSERLGYVKYPSERLGYVKYPSEYLGYVKYPSEYLGYVKYPSEYLGYVKYPSERLGKPGRDIQAGTPLECGQTRECGQGKPGPISHLIVIKPPTPFQETSNQRDQLNGNSRRAAGAREWVECSEVGSDQSMLELAIWTCRSFHTVGIMPGSWWAHHELGRGGWWFRDPVENASACSRLIATSSLHAVNRPFLAWWSSLLSIWQWVVCLSGSFSIRSGVLSTVHSFAVD